MKMTIFFLLLLSINAEAKKKRSGASQMPASSFVACVEEAVLGDAEDQCRGLGESEACVGLKRALELSQKKTECFRRESSQCVEWGHDGKTQAQWISVAAHHLNKFGGCVQNRYGSEQNSGFTEALADDGLIAFLKRLDDGGKVFRLTESAILIGTLKEHRFGYILQNSPLAKEITPHELYLFTTAADTPVAKPERRVTAGANPSQEGENFREIAREYFPEEIPVSPGSQTIVVKTAAAPLKAPTRMVAATAPTKKYGAFGLGIDRSLFERVSSAYQRNSGELRVLEEYLKAYPPAPAKDLGELLSQGGTL